MKIEDLAGLGKFGEKLLSVLERFIGDEVQPRQIRRVAYAQADALRIRAEAQADALVTIEDGKARVLEVQRRAIRRLLAQESRRQENIEAIAYQAAKNPPSKVSPKLIADDWISLFLESCQDVSDDEMQALWGRLLAGGISKPRAVSKLLLHSVRLMSVEDARAFSNLSCETFDSNPNVPNIDRPVFFADSKGTMGHSLDLERFFSLGLVHDGASLQAFGWKAKRETIFFGRKAVFLANSAVAPTGRDAFTGITVRRFTQTGRELVKIVRPRAPQPLPQMLVEKFKKEGFKVFLDNNSL